ncbi:MAG: glycosyltransferase family 9 protein [Alphaproteobacteria bacterium]|nr:glycosyltransferase family 9 protein [Alphaproteobacteria bacterium]
MPLSFLRILDTWVGKGLLFILALPLRWIAAFLPIAANRRRVFLKMKGGGSLIIAFPSLLGLRRQYPQDEFILVCTRESKIYAELTGVFDRFVSVDDTKLSALILSGIKAVRACFRAAQCIDLEPNSILAAVFTMLTCATERVGFVSPRQPERAAAYSVPISYDPAAPIYVYYDKLCEQGGAAPASAQDCRERMLALLPPRDTHAVRTPSPPPWGGRVGVRGEVGGIIPAPPLTPNPSPPKEGERGFTVAIAAFSSDFARERMMPPQTWAALLRRVYADMPLRIVMLGSSNNIHAAQTLCDLLQIELPSASVVNGAGTCTLAQTAARMLSCDEIWSIDSGLLHIARALGVSTRSFWGPTMPTQRLRPIEGLSEKIFYHPLPCSPCIPSTAKPPCSGYNLCMINMAEEKSDSPPS